MVKSCISISSLYFIKTWCHISIRKSTQAQRENTIFSVELRNVSSSLSSTTDFFHKFLYSPPESLSWNTKYSLLWFNNYCYWNAYLTRRRVIQTGYKICQVNSKGIFSLFTNIFIINKQQSLLTSEHTSLDSNTNLVITATFSLFSWSLLQYLVF